MLSNVLESRLIKNCYNESHFSVSYGFVPICCESQFACPDQFCSNLLCESICLSWPVLFQFAVRVNLSALASFVTICYESQFVCPGQFRSKGRRCIYLWLTGRHWLWQTMYISLIYKQTCITGTIYPSGQ